MYNESKEDKAQQIKDILRLHLLEACTYKEITDKVGVSRPTARKYIDKFKEIISNEDFAIKDTYNEVKRRKEFPTRWNKYVKKMVATHARHPKRIATPAMCKKILQTARTVGMSAIATHNELKKSKGIVPSYEIIAKVIREYVNKNNPPIEE